MANSVFTGLVVVVGEESAGRVSDPVLPNRVQPRHTARRVVDDLVAAMAELRRCGVTRVALVGASIGGSAALIAGTRVQLCNRRGHWAIG